MIEMEATQMDMVEIRKKDLRKNKKILKAVETLLRELGEDPEREGLKRTPYRVAKAYEEWFGGYGFEPKDVLNRQFEEGKLNDLVIEGPIDFYSHCEHHIAPFYGHMWVGYIPDKHVTGLDKMVKLVEIYARRLQVQERLTDQVADGMFKGLKCKGVMVVCKAYHLCVGSRETKNPTTYTTTSAVRGIFKNDRGLKNEFLQLIKLGGQ